MKIDKNSHGTLAVVYAVILAVILAGMILKAPTWLWIIIYVFSLVFGVWQTLFFRVPKRKKHGDSRRVSSVADGKVVIIDRIFEKEFLKRDCIMVSVYMNFFDVHANFWPVSGEITYSCYHPGKHFLAFKPKASDENEHHCVGIRTPEGKEIFFKQLAGTFARRIVNYARVGDSVTAGEQCGIIKFGSRIDLYLPLDADIRVRLGELTRACETILAEL